MDSSFDDRESDAAVRSALLAERSAYDAMRRLVPDLDLPASRRSPLTPAQQAAVDRYHELRDLLEALRGTHRRPASSGLRLVRR